MCFKTPKCVPDTGGPLIHVTYYINQQLGKDNPDHHQSNIPGEKIVIVPRFSDRSHGKSDSLVFFCFGCHTLRLSICRAFEQFGSLHNVCTKEIYRPQWNSSQPRYELTIVAPSFWRKSSKYQEFTG